MEDDHAGACLPALGDRVGNQFEGLDSLGRVCGDVGCEGWDVGKRVFGRRGGVDGCGR